jgi:hypothetical protein
MTEHDTTLGLRWRLMQRLVRAAEALSNEGTDLRDALAIARNSAAAVLSDVETMGDSPALAR